MTVKELETRIERLEAQVARLQAAALQQPEPERDWRKAVEKWSGNEDMLHLLEGARKVREADRAKARKANRKSRKKSA